MPLLQTTKTALFPASESILPAVTADTSPLTHRTQDHIIEPELLVATPRKVVTPHSTIVTRCLCINLLIGLALLNHWLSHSFGEFLQLLRGCSISSYAFFAWIFIEYCYAYERHQLRHYRAIPATVQERTVKYQGSQRIITLRYAFEIEPGSLVVRSITTRQENRLDRGDTFTLLQDPKKPDHVVPYFTLKAARLADAPVLPPRPQ